MKPQDAWKAAYHQLELQLDRASFDTWLRPAVFLKYEEGVFYIGTHSSYARDMLAHRMYRGVRRVLSDVWGQPIELNFEIHKSAPAEPAWLEPQPDDGPLFRLLARQAVEPPAEDESLGALVAPPQQPALPESELNPRFTFERFIVNGSNQVVHEAARAVADYPANVYNPFLVYGGVGLGKTHILQAIGHRCVARGLRTIYIPSEVFTNDLIHAIRNRTTAMFRDRYRSVDVLLVDDIQFIAGKETTQEEFFHTFNALVNFNKQIVLASDRHPRELATLEDRLRSRFQGGLVADIQPPEYETRIAILRMWDRERELDLEENVIEMLAHRAPASIRELEGLFNQIVAQAQSRGGISLNRAESTLARYESPREQLTLDLVITRVAYKLGFSDSDITGPRRTARINQARQIAMYIARELTHYSLPQIGEAFGGRSHTTVLHGCNKIADDLASDPVLSAKVQGIIRYVLKGR